MIAGGDWGGMLSKALGLFHSDHCKGIHVNFSAAAPQPYNPLHILQGINAFVPILDRIPLLLSSEEIQHLKDSKHWLDHETGGFCYAIQEPSEQSRHPVLHEHHLYTHAPGLQTQDCSHLLIVDRGEAV